MEQIRKEGRQKSYGKVGQRELIKTISSNRERQPEPLSWNDNQRPVQVPFSHHRHLLISLFDSLFSYVKIQGQNVVRPTGCVCAT
jgi:hypothetical protein